MGFGALLFLYVGEIKCGISTGSASYRCSTFIIRQAALPGTIGLASG